MTYENTEALFDKKDFPYASITLSVMENVDLHCHKDAEIVFMISGTLEILYNQRIYKISAGDVFLIAPFTSHALINPSSDCTRQIHVIDFSVISSISPDEQMEACSHNWPVKHKETFIATLQEMHQEYTAKEYAWELAVTGLANRLLLICLRHIPKSKDEVKNKVVNKMQVIIEYIASNFNKRISLQECAGELKLNPSYISRFFKKNMGMTFQDYVKNSRIEKSKILLLSSQKAITEICFEAGFTDISTFNKLFRASVGSSPSSYRKENR